MNGARVRPAPAERPRPQVEDQDLVAGAVHARDRAPGQRMAGDQAFSPPSRLGRAAAREARRPVDHPRAEPGRPPRAGPRPRSARRRRARRFAARRDRRDAALVASSGGSGPWRKAILPMQRQPRCAFTRATMIEALCCASSANAPSTRSTSVAGVAGASGSRLAGTRRPLQLDRAGVAGEGRADDLRPVGDQARSRRGPRAASAAATSPAMNSPSGSAPRRAGFIMARAWGSGFDRMGANVSALGGKAKRKAIVARTLRWWDRHRRALAWRAAPGEAPDPYRVWLSEVLLQQTTVQAATPYFRPSSHNGRGSRTWPPRRSRR